MSTVDISVMLALGDEEQQLN